MATNTMARVANDLGLAMWLGGTARNVVRRRPPLSDDAARARARSDARRWMPVALGSMAAAMLGGARLAEVNLPRIRGQAGVAGAAATKTAMLAAGAAATTVAEVAALRGGAGRTQRLLAATATMLVGGALVSDARLGEQQRPAAQAKGMMRRLARSRRR